MVHPPVLCRRRSLACLDGFLQRQEVWVFYSSSLLEITIGALDDVVERPISLLTTIDKFAGVWGPVFAVKTSGEEENGILQYNAGNGVIRPFANAETGGRFKGAVACHWAAEPGHFLRRISRTVWNFLDPFPKMVMKKDDVLLIGHILGCNDGGCEYSLSDFEWDYSERISPLKQYLGVEMSHCTGNARRVTLGDLLFNRGMREYLDLLFPRWENKEWTSKFREVLESDNIHDLLRFWKENMKRGEIGELVTKLLELLDDTGSDGFKFRATMLYNHQLFTVEFPTKFNTWTSHLRDSHLSAAYVFMSEKCLTSSKPPGECR